MVLWQTVSSIGQRSTWFTLLSACRFVEFDTSVCQVFMHCFGSFLLQAMFVSLQVFVFKRQNMKLTVDVVYLYCSHFYSDMGPVPKFRNGKRCWKLEKQNTWLKPEMTSYLCFSPQRILRLPRYSLTFGFPWTHPSVHSSWYQRHNCSSNMTRIQALFWLGYTSNRQCLLWCASHFLFRARFLWRSAICKLAMKWYPMRVCTRWLYPLKYGVDFS